MFFFEQQELLVIASALYASPDLLKWNRENFTDYFEVYLKASVDLVKKEILRTYTKNMMLELKET